MDLKVGRRKLIALGGAAGVAVVALAAWWLFGTDALLAVLLAVSTGSSLVLGWLLAQSERRVTRVVNRLQRDVQASRRFTERLDRRIDARLAAHLDEVVGQMALDSREQTESLLKVMSSSAKRFEITQQKLLDSQGETLGFQQQLLDSQQQLLGSQHELFEGQERAGASLDRISNRMGRESDRVVGALRSHVPSLKQLRWETKQLFRQLEALMALYAAARPSTSFPSTRTWAAAPDLLSFLYQTVRTRRPHLILECGSGVSTIVMGYALKSNGQGQIVSLEHLDEFRQTTMDWVTDHNLAEWIDVRLAPLTDFEVAGERWPWYSMEGVPDSGIDLLFVDGPPGPTRKNARFPALPLLYDRLNSEALVILDDYSREDESTVTQRWVELFPEFEMSTVDHEKGTALFEVPPDGGGTG